MLQVAQCGPDLNINAVDMGQQTIGTMGIERGIGRIQFNQSVANAFDNGPR